MASLLNAPYPKPVSQKAVWLPACAVAATVYFFLAVFQPFGTYAFSDPFKYARLLPYSAIALVVFAAANLLAGRTSKPWSTMHEIAKLGLVLTVCGVLNYLYCARWINHEAWNPGRMVLMLIFTFATGLPVGGLYILGVYVVLRKGPFLSPELPPPVAVAHTGTMLHINPSVGDDLRIPEAAFLCAHSEGNYCNVFYLNDGSPTRQLLRIPLSQLEQQIAGGTIVRCHRSYLVHTGKITRARGNAQGYQLQIEGMTEAVPVSRSYVDRMRPVL